ncbi:hypothetical protein BV22DRAFT_1010299 [Leucogyrophana mollusca]|uniref:Uncharacterized protein n=1 Tax=Leucogyrophana mollusca TaxID=85980 RepID=A0ACB8BKW1_9AGAM|nr:hypothetical protein BV22DRAFT_1010299 [Leucogyrophana mollusca]
MTTTSAPSTSTSVDTNYNYLSTISSLLLNSVPTTAAHTMSDPDQAETTHSLASAAPTAAPSAPPLPSNLPRVILPQPQLNTSTLPSNDEMISVLFNQSLNWEWVATSSDTPGQIFEYFPQVIATALGISASSVYNYELLVYEPLSYSGPSDSAQLGTIWQGYIPQANVQTLASLISNQKSSFYTGQGDPIASTLAACVDPSLDLESMSGPTPGGDSGNSSNGNSGKVRQDAIIGVVSSLGAIALLVLAYVVYRSLKRRRELAHRRLSDPDGAAPEGLAGARPDGQEFDRDSVGGQRRRSFYYAEDSLRGYQGVRSDEDAYDHHVSTGMRERRAVNTGVISAPILRESSMNW